MVMVIRLMGRTGVCIDSLTIETQIKVLKWCIKVLSQREFIDVLLPWVNDVHEQQSIEFEDISLLIECLLKLLN